MPFVFGDLLYRIAVVFTNSLEYFKPFFRQMHLTTNRDFATTAISKRVSRPLNIKGGFLK